MTITYNNNFNTNDRFLDLESLIIDLLPSGSGIDAKWVVQQDKIGSLYAFNSYTCYTEYGYLDAYADFYIKIKLVNCELHITDLKFANVKAQYLNKKYMIRDYLESIFFDPSHLQNIAVCNNAKIDITNYL